MKTERDWSEGHCVLVAETKAFPSDLNWDFRLIFRPLKKLEIVTWLKYDEILEIDSSPSQMNNSSITKEKHTIAFILFTLSS